MLESITAEPEPRDVTERDAIRFVEDHGVVLEAARGPVPSLADAVLGRRRRGSWWGHPRGKEFFWLTRRVRASGDVLVCRLVEGRVTYVHRRLWPALARFADVIPPERLAAIREEHTKSGAHRVRETPFRRWVQPEVLTAAAALTEREALDQFGDWISETSHLESRRRAT